MMMFVRDCNVTLDTEGIDFLLRHSIKIKEVQDAVAATYGVHSGRVGHTVPIVDDYSLANPRAGGIIGGAGGPGAVGRVKAEMEKERAAKALIESLAAGVAADQQLQQGKSASSASRKPYKVRGGAIFTEDGKVLPGQKAMLTSEQARKFDAEGRIGPWIDD